jgi:hypothetical protein
VEGARFMRRYRCNHEHGMAGDKKLHIKIYGVLCLTIYQNNDISEIEAIFRRNLCRKYGKVLICGIIMEKFPNFATNIKNLYSLQKMV